MSLPAAQQGRGSTVVFGGLLMCTTGDEPVTIRGVEFQSEVPSTQVHSAIRQIPPASERENPNSM